MIIELFRDGETGQRYSKRTKSYTSTIALAYASALIRVSGPEDKDRFPPRFIRFRVFASTERKDFAPLSFAAERHGMPRPPVSSCALRSLVVPRRVAFALHRIAL